MKKLFLAIMILVAVGIIGFILMPNLREFSEMVFVDAFDDRYAENCGSCHGDNLEGSGIGPSLLGPLEHGESLQAIRQSIRDGYPEKGMPAWKNQLEEKWIHNLALYVAERRQDNRMTDFKVDHPLEIPSDSVKTRLHDFTVEVVADNIDKLPYSFALLPSGDILLTEKGLGVSLIDKHGNKRRIKNTPKVYNEIERTWGQPMGLGWMLDVALHPDYQENGWVYLAYTERCEDCNAASRGFDPYTKKMGRPVSMTKLVRGQIVDDRWVNQQVIYEANINSYSTMFDLSAGGRIDFDQQGYVYLTVGHKADPDHLGIQDLTQPFGKIHRMHDDGRVPADNPFVSVDGALKTIWSLGHRNPEGLAFNAMDNTLWQSEMGPRGGDEINLIVKGGNYGWPFHTSGINYDGSPVDYTEELGEPIPIEQTQLPILDITPSTAVSSIVFYSGSQFPGWENNLLLCNLKASDLIRLVIENNKVVEQEVLLEDLGRFRDIEVAEDGSIYILIEHVSGSKLLRIQNSEL